MDKAESIKKIFVPGLKEKADALTAKYETKRAPVLMILRLVQEHYGYVSQEAQDAVAHYLGLPEIDVHEVMTFYTLFYDKPRAKTEFHVCRTLTCNLMGAEHVIKCLQEKLGVKEGEITADGQFMFDQVECLGACEIAPMLQVNEGEFVGQLTPEKMKQLIEDAAKGKLEALKEAKKTPLEQ